MYAIIKSGGRQYRVEKNAEIDVDILPGAVGGSVEFKDVLFVHNGTEALVGEPIVSNYIVRGELLGEAAGPKVVSFKFKRRKSTRRKVGHRQGYTRVRIIDIVG